MGLPKYVRRSNKRYYLYETYPTWREAYNIGRYYKRKNKSKYWIMQYESGFLFPKMRFALYMSRVVKLW